MDGTAELLFYVNGRKVIEKNVDPETMLLPYLRKKLRLTGTKYGCGAGGCGACTVMISRCNPITKRIRHYPANACLIPICSLYGAAVTTVEGIGSTKTRIHPVQERIAKCHGTQCGFCTPGMVMSIYTLLRNHPEPTLSQLTDALGGNLCRCTGYRPIIDACKTFCKTSGCCQSKENGVCCLDQGINGLPEFEGGNETNLKLFSEEEFLPLDPTQELIFPPELMTMAEKQPQRTRIFDGDRMTWISPVTLKELLETKVKYPQAPVVMGNTSVGPDVKFKGIFHPVIISPDGIEELSVVNYTDNGLTLGAALSLAQVKDILANVILKLPEEKTQMYHALLKHLGTLAGSQIRNMASLGGHIVSRHPDSDLNPLLAVGNCTLNLLSKEGKRQIPLNEQFLRKCPSADLKPEEILISVNIPYLRKWEFVSAFRQAQRQQNALAIVNSGMRVFFGGGDGIIRELSIAYGGVGPTTICAKNSCQKLIGRRWNEEMLDAACRLILDEVSLPGSAPGGRVEFRRTLIISFLFKFYLEVSQILKRMDPVHYPSLTDKYESALEELHSRHHWRTLKYQNADPKQLPQDPVGHPIMHLSGIKHATGEAIYCDDMPAVDRELFLTFVTSSRAHAKTVSVDLSEALSLPGVVDILTEEHLHGINSFRLLTKPEKLLSTDEVFCVGELVCAVIADSEVQAKRAAQRVKIVYRDLEPLILTIEAAALVHIYLDGSVLVTHGGIEMGQGVHTKMIQVASRELRMPLSNIHLRGTSTETVPNANISGGSVVADLNGLAVKDACRTLLKRLEPIISKNPGGTWKDWAQAAFDESISLSATGYFRGYESNMNWETGEGRPFEYFVYGAACSEVEIDCLTGAHKNIRTDIVMDVGCSINPALDIGQIEGAFIQGMGLYTIEELNYSPQGVLYTRGPNQYKIPAICDIPTELHVSLLPPSQNSNTLYSSKGLGESGVFLGCSVFFAIQDAVSAARQERGLFGPLKLNSPLTPEKIRMACEDKFTKMIPRDEPGSYVPWSVPI
ncbi:aldehyde oxidase [Balaenoptera musculus]|uniref:aldehyde oxidase n=1 Tax=Balaenoptera musculus TaxID=9771 RepID=A0A8B8XVM9_BALMU|nr:aldehyde oxidase [Balaenoptera musculus]